MKNFKRDSKDCIEQLFKKDILKKFPLYATFWNKFIGNKEKAPLKPYGLKIPISLRARKNDILNAYLEITYAHYTLFCRLAGAHFQLKELRRSLKYKNSWKKHFRHWEHFEVFYMHLGSAMYQVYHLWKLLFLLKRNNGGPKKLLEDFLISKREKHLFNEIEAIDNEIIILRDNITHYSRVIHLPLADGGYAIPLKNKRNASWKKQARAKLFYETRMKCQNDLGNFEEIINKLHQILMDEMDAYFVSNRIKINY